MNAHDVKDVDNIFCQGRPERNKRQLPPAKLSQAQWAARGVCPSHL